jgi:glucokinase
LTLIDGLAVIGGGLSKGHPLFLPTLVEKLNGFYADTRGKQFHRLASTAFNLEDPEQLGTFLMGDIREIMVPGNDRKIKHDPLQRTGVGMSRLGTSVAVAVGANAFALKKLL